MKQILSCCFCVLLTVKAVSQNVGIGTTTPQTKLHVADSSNSVEAFIQTFNTNTNAALRLINGDLSGTFSALSFEKRGVSDAFANNIQGTSGRMLIGTVGNSPMLFATNNTERLRIDSIGNIGIGTQTPKAALEINGDNFPTMAVRSQNFSPTLAFKLADSIVGYIYADKYFGRGLTLYSGKGILNPGDIIPPISITPGNNYGATFYPNGRTVIAGNYVTQLGLDTAATLNVINQSTLGNPQLNLQDDYSGNFARLQFSNSNSSKYWHVAGLAMDDSTQARLNFFYKGVGDIMSITGDGKVGIGTTVPQTALHINSNANNEALRLQANNFPGLTFYIGNNLHSQIKTNGNYLDFATSAGYGFSFSPNNVTKMIMDYNGNVGIGTAAPNNKLEVIGTVRIADGTQGLNKIFSSDAVGNASWVDPGTLTKTDTMYISGFNFKSLNPTAQVHYDEAGSAYLLSGSDLLYAPIILPQGAAIQTVKFRYIDNNSTQRMYLQVMACSLISNFNSSTTYLLWNNNSANQVPYQSNAPLYLNGSFVGTNQSQNIISNTAYHYYITAYVGNGGPEAWDGTIQVRGVEIIYTTKL